MAKNVLPVDFQDDILAESMNGRRKYQMITNSDGTVSFVDVTEYTQVGSNFGQAQVNATNEAVNESADKNKIIDDKDDLVANSQAGMMAGALAVKAIREELNQNLNTEYEKILEITDLTGAGIIPGFRNYKEFVIMISASGYITSHYLAKNMITTPINLQSSYTYESAGSRMAAIRIDANGTYTLAPGMEQNSQNSSVVIYAR